MIKVTSRGIPELKAWLATIARGLKTKATEYFAEYIVGDQSHGLMHYPAYKYIPYKSAYGGFKSDKQRRYVMAAIKEGKIDPGYPHRTGNFQRGWEYKASGAGRYTIKNETPYAGYVMGDRDQARMPAMIGWRKVAEVIKSNFAGAVKHAQAQIKEWLKSQKRA